MDFDPSLRARFEKNRLGRQAFLDFDSYNMGDIAHSDLILAVYFQFLKNV